jgi:ERCC4-related helicase
MTDGNNDQQGSGGDERLFSPGVQVRVRDEQWLVKKVLQTRHDGQMLEVTGVSPFVRGADAVFYTKLDKVKPLDPRRTALVADGSPHHRRARLHLEATIRKTALPQTEHGLALADSFLMDRQTHQLRPAEKALSMENPQPRILIADVVGLGKTLEIGLLLAELIRRGRGERILVVTPAHVLEQFQRELWTRFALPLVRLDTTGIQRIQQDIPSGRNPFVYFKRAIISVDTLKSRVYAPHLRNTDWDAVVIDESHNLLNRGTQNNDLATLLARRTDALILASATPHNGSAESFAELVNFLDEAAIANPAEYDVRALDHLYIRRTKTSPEVRDSLKGAWADRGPSEPIAVEATASERELFAQLAERWIPGDRTKPSVSVDPLFPYTLFKSFLSSHKAMLETVNTRLNTLNSPSKRQNNTGRVAERAALMDLQRIGSAMTDYDSAKLNALVSVLKDIGVGPGSDTRVVVFSERIPTLSWLAQVVPGELGFAADGVQDRNKPWSVYSGVVHVMHGKATSDDEQKMIVEKFGLRDDPVRILFAGDVASEGVNLHQQCHQLIHYDLPWSLIRIEQRNGRIDRYGQAYPPEFRAILLTSDVPWRTSETGDPLSLDDRLVGLRLLEREEQAHRIEGSAEAVTGLYKADEEEARLTKDLIAGKTVDRSITESHAAGANFLANLMGNVGIENDRPDVAIAQVPTLFESTAKYFEEALHQICPTGPEDEIALHRGDDGTIAFEPPPDLQYRLKALPKSYLDEQGILPTSKTPGRLRITFDKHLAARRLEVARNSSKTMWPNVSYVSDIHPVLDWVTDKALAEIRHDEAFVLAFKPDADRAQLLDERVARLVSGPIFLVQGVYSNALGRPTVVEWMAVLGLPDAPLVVPMDEQLLDVCGVGPKMPGARVGDLDRFNSLVPRAIDEAEQHLLRRKTEYDEQVDKLLEPYRARLRGWRKATQEALFGPAKSRADVTADRREEFIAALRTSGTPMLRLLALLVPMSIVKGQSDER